MGLCQNKETVKGDSTKDDSEISELVILTSFKNNSNDKLLEIRSIMLSGIIFDDNMLDKIRNEIKNLEHVIRTYEELIQVKSSEHTLNKLLNDLKEMKNTLKEIDNL